MKRLSIFNSIPLPVGLLLLARLAGLLAFPIEGYRGFGDFANFFQIVRLPGWPYLNFWVEFPPVFPFLSAALFRLAGGRETTYDYLLALILILADVGNLLLFIRLTRRLFGKEGDRRIWIYLMILVSLAYTWWYFDPLAVFALLLALTYMFDGRDIAAGIALALGILTKFFPILVLIIAWRYLPWRRAALMSALALGIVMVVFGGLYLASPAYTRASLASQSSKGSWETIWAMVDGNYSTGNFGSVAERLEPGAAYLSQRNQAVVHPLVTLVIFGGIGIIGLIFARKKGPLRMLSFLGFTWSLMLLWSPGWSPQWILYLLPLILLTLPDRESALFSVTLIFINLLEWPVLLSRGLTEMLWLSVLMRTLIFALLAWLWYQQVKQGDPDTEHVRLPDHQAP